MRSGPQEYEPWGFILNKLPGKMPYLVKYSGQSYIPSLAMYWKYPILS